MTVIGDAVVVRPDPATGATGIAVSGPPGPPGNNLIISKDPPDPNQGSVGDWWIETSNGAIFQKIDVTDWGSAVANLITNLNYAPLDSPTFSGQPTAPTPPTDDRTNRLATTSLLQSLLDSYLPKVSGAMQGEPTAPTPAGQDNSSRIATTSFVIDHMDDLITGAGFAPIDSPAFTGSPTAPTPLASDNDTSIATTAFVKTTVAAIVDSAPGALDTLNELAAALGDDANYATTVTNALAAKAPLASPTFTGTPAAPTASVDTNTTQLATTAFCLGQASSATPLVDGTATAGTSTKYAREGHVHPSDMTLFDGDKALDTDQQQQARINLAASPLSAFVRSCGVQNNGRMEISQAGEYAALTGTGSYAVDGWITSWSGAMGITHQGVNTSPFSSYPQIVNALKISCTTADTSIGAGDYVTARSAIEGWRLRGFGWGTSAAMPISIGHVLRSNISHKIYLSVRNSAANRSYVKAIDLVADTDTYVEITIPGDTSGTWLTNSGVGLYVALALTAGSTYQGTANSWQAANLFAASDIGNFCSANTNILYIGPHILLPGGDGASAPELPSVERMLSALPNFADELLAQRRYYFGVNFEGYAYYRFGLGQAIGATAALYMIYFPVRMRACPTFAGYDTLSNLAVSDANGGTVAISTLALNSASYENAFMRADVGTSTWSSGVATFLTANNATAARLRFDARL